MTDPETTTRAGAESGVWIAPGIGIGLAIGGAIAALRARGAGE